MKKKLTKGQRIRRKMMFEVVENQIKQNNPPETKQTLERLQREGYSREESMELIASVVVSEMFDTLKQQKPFNEERFVKRLNELPKLPWQ